VNEWTNTTTYPNLASNLVDDADLIPVADMSLAAGSRQRTLTVGALKALTGTALTTVVSSAGALTLDANLHRGAHVRITAAGNVTIPAGLPVGWSCVVSNATASATVALVDSAVTLLSAGVSISNGKWVALVVVNTNVVEAVGAFADEVVNAASIAYDNTTSGLAATTVQAAIDELAALP
jgi:hypothetical protein